MHAILLLCGGLASDDGWLKASALDTIRRREANVDMEQHRPLNNETVVALDWRVMVPIFPFCVLSVDGFGPLYYRGTRPEYD